MGKPANNPSQPDEIPIPTFQDTFLFRGPKFIYNTTIGRVLHKQTVDHEIWEANGAPLEDTIEGSEPTLAAAVPPNAEAESRRRKVKR